MYARGTWTVSLKELEYKQCIIVRSSTTANEHFESPVYAVYLTKATGDDDPDI